MRMLLKVITLMFSLASLPVLLIRLQPYDDAQLRALFLPEDCAAPCFLGIQPGVTTATQALDLLREHPWVRAGSITRRSRFNVVRIEWQWNGSQPGFLRLNPNAIAVATILPGFNSDPDLTAEERVITGMVIFTSIPYGDVHLLLGESSNRGDYVVSRDFINAQISAVYPRHKLAILSQIIPCPVSAADFWNEPVLVEIGYTFVDDRLHICKGLG